MLTWLLFFIKIIKSLNTTRLITVVLTFRFTFLKKLNHLPSKCYSRFSKIHTDSFFDVFYILLMLFGTDKKGSKQKIRFGLTKKPVFTKRHVFSG